MRASLFQILVSLVIISETIRSFSSFVTGPDAEVGVDTESQGLCHSLVEFPLPMIFPRSCMITFLPSMILFQPCDAEVEHLILRKDSEWQYLPRSILESKQSGFVRILQESLPRRALLKCWISLKPSPPMLFGLVILSHEIQQIFCFVITVPPKLGQD